MGLLLEGEEGGEGEGEDDDEEEEEEQSLRISSTVR